MGKSARIYLASTDSNGATHVVHVPKSTAVIFESMGFKEVTPEDMMSRQKAKEEQDLANYKQIKEEMQKKEEPVIEGLDEWEEIEKTETDEVEDIIEIVKTTPVSELTLAQMRDFGKAIGNEGLIQAKRTVEARKKLEGYLDSLEE